MKFICLFFPALLATSEGVKKKDDILKIILLFSKYCLYINFIMILVLVVIGEATSYFDSYTSVRFYALYLLVGIVSAKVLPKVLEFCRNNFKIKIRRITK